ncbi:hypothetical protein Tco_0172466 [Tanacetum coccineum]
MNQLCLNQKKYQDKVIIEDWNSDDEDDVSAVKIVSPVKTNETQTVRNQVDKIGQISQKEGIGFKKIKAFFVCKSSDHLIKDCDFYAKKSPTPKAQMGKARNILLVLLGLLVLLERISNKKRKNIKKCDKNGTRDGKVCGEKPNQSKSIREE